MAAPARHHRLATELGATDGERVDDPLPIDTTRQTRRSLAQVALTYANADGDYNTASEHSDRLLSNLTTKTTQLPLAMTSAEAKGVADAMVQDAYAGRFSGRRCSWTSPTWRARRPTW